MINTYVDAKKNAEKACKADLIGFLEMQLGTERIYLDEHLKKYKDTETGAEFFYCHDDGYKYSVWETVDGKRVKTEGDDAIKYLRKYFDYGFVGAVDALCSYGNGTGVFDYYKAEEHKKNIFSKKSGNLIHPVFTLSTPLSTGENSASPFLDFTRFILNGGSMSPVSRFFVV